jgi:hypothetical protein
MTFANAIPPKMKRHSTANMTTLFVGIGKLSGNFMLLDQVRCPPAVSRRLGLLAVSANV